MMPKEQGKAPASQKPKLSWNNRKMGSGRAHDIPWNGERRTLQGGLCTGTELPQGTSSRCRMNSQDFQEKSHFFFPFFCQRNCQHVHSSPGPGGLSGAAPLFSLSSCLDELSASAGKNSRNSKCWIKCINLRVNLPSHGHTHRAWNFHGTRRKLRFQRAFNGLQGAPVNPTAFPTPGRN